MRKGETMSAAQRTLTSEAHKGIGHPQSSATREKIRNTMRGRTFTVEHKANLVATWHDHHQPVKSGKDNPFFGHHHTDKNKQIFREAHLDKPLSDETRKRMSVATSGENNPNYGKTMSDDQRAQISKALTGKQRSADAIAKQRAAIMGDKHYNWRGGVSFEPYSLDWTRTLRRSIRERDHYTCRLCGVPQGDVALDVHHVDYVKSHCDPMNLISLCHSCHMKTNADREFWTGLLQSVMEVVDA